MSTDRIWPRPVVLPLPEALSEDAAAVLLNSDDWQILRSLEGDPWDADEGAWEQVKVPLQQPMTDKTYAYRREFTVPAAYAGQRVFLRFDGVNCDVRIYIGNNFAGSHYGGFVAWNREITDFVVPGEKATLYVVSNDDPGGVCPFQFGGIIRDVTLFALPKTYIARFHALTDLDAAYKDAVLNVHLRLAGGEGNVRVRLVDPEGKEIELRCCAACAEAACPDAEAACKASDNACAGAPAVYKAPENACAEASAPCAEASAPSYALPADVDTVLSFPVAAPFKWDAEHPYLYNLTVELLAADGTVTERTSRRIGFRKIEKCGKKIFLNGKVLKLRGINHHDIHPKLGKAITTAIAEEDVKLFKEANINFVRTSHYPPRPDFLDFCDEYGIYIEDETAVAFLGQGVDCRENDPAFTEKIMQPFAEFLERDLSHPCVILWSLANECFWGTNLALENAYAHQEDPSRLTIFSYPITQKEDDDRADIWSMHYAGWDQKPDALVDSFNRSCHEPVIWPVLHDESTHIPCYARNDLRRDPAVRDFYGETISRFWDKLWEDEASLGCAIWAGIDDVWENNRYGRFGAPWGIIDGWRRKKPEHWHVRKAYAPVRLRGVEMTADGLLLTLENRFNHTNLNEVTIRFKSANAEGAVRGSDVPPREEGQVLIPMIGLGANAALSDAALSGALPGAALSDAAAGECRILLTFFDAWGRQVQEEEVCVCEAAAEITEVIAPAAEKKELEICEDEETLTLAGEDFRLCFSKESGLITEGSVAGTPVVTGGPYLHLTGLPLAPWKKEAFFWTRMCGGARLVIAGAYGKVRVCFEMRIDAEGCVETDCTIVDMPYASPRKLAMRIGDDTDSGGYEEVGIRFTLPAEMEKFFWKKQGLWSVFPENHIGRSEGEVKIAARTCGETAACDGGPCSPVPAAAALHSPDAPACEWKDDLTDYVVFGPYDIPLRGSRDLRSLKSGIFSGGVSRSVCADAACADTACADAACQDAACQDAANASAAFTVLSDGSDSLRLRFTPDASMIIDDRDSRLTYKGSWRQMNTGFGSLNGTESWSDEEGASCTVKFSGTGIVWVGSADILGGVAEVYLDGELVDPSIRLGTRLLTPGIARGYEKDPQRLLYAKDGLTEGEHTLTIRVTGKRTPGSSGAYVFIDHFIVLGNNERWIPELIIDSEFNYPELSWGCYTKPPVTLATGDRMNFVACLGKKP